MTRRQTRIVIVTAVVLGIMCLGMLFWALNQSPDPVAEPVPVTTTAAPTTTSTTTGATTTAPTTTAPPTTTAKPPVKTPVAPPKPTTQPPATTAAAPHTTVNVLCRAAAPWQRDTAYDGGSVVLHDGGEWYARSWNYNAEPGANAENVWIRALTC